MSECKGERRHVNGFDADRLPLFSTLRKQCLSVTWDTGNRSQVDARFRAETNFDLATD